MSDRLFKAKTIDGKTVFLYVLIEHKSTPDRKIGWQLLRYIVEILKQWEKENPKWQRLPAVVPFVFYHGADEWRTPNEFAHLVNAESTWKPYLLNFRFPVLDIGKIPDGQLSKDPRLRVWLLAMKYATREKQQIAVKALLIEALRNAPDDLRAVMYYLVKNYPRYRKETLQEIIQKVQPEEEREMMSQFARDIIAGRDTEWREIVRQEAIQEGKQEGIRQGMQQGMQQGLLKGEATLLLRQLSRRFQPLPDAISERIYAASPNAIEIWADRILDAKSLDEVFLESP